MRIQSIWPFVLFHFEKDEKVNIENCLEALKEFGKKYGDKIISKKSIKEAKTYYKKLLEESK